MGPVGAALFWQTGYDCQASRKCCMTKDAYDCAGRVEQHRTANQNQMRRTAPKAYICTYPPKTFFLFFNDTATTEIYTLSLHVAIPICWCSSVLANRQ